MTTPEIYESLKTEYEALSKKLQGLCSSGDLRCAFISFEYADGSVTNMGGGNYGAFIGMIEIAKHKMLEQRRESYLKRNKEFNESDEPKSEPNP